MGDQQFSNNMKQVFIDHANKFTVIVKHVREKLIIKKRNLSFDRKDIESSQFWINCIEDASNSLGMSLSDVEKGDIIKGIVYLLYELFFDTPTGKSREEALNGVFNG